MKPNSFMAFRIKKRGTEMVLRFVGDVLRGGARKERLSPSAIF